MESDTGFQSRASGGEGVSGLELSRRESYVLGFCFDVELDRVVLARKVSPPWQAGMLNGLGGHVEAGESPEAAMSREFREESGCDAALDWRAFGRLRGDDFEVALFCTMCSPHVLVPAAPASPEGEVRFHDVGDVLQVPGALRPLPDLRWLVPMAANFLRGEGEFFLDVCERPLPKREYF